MITISGNFGSIADVVRSINVLRDSDIPKVATAWANNIGFKAKKKIDSSITSKLNIKKAQLKKPTKVIKATRAKPFLTVHIPQDSWQYKALAHHFSGGDRDRKNFEDALKAKGKIRGDQIVIPLAKITKSGYRKMLSGISSGAGTGGRNSTKYFIGGGKAIFAKMADDTTIAIAVIGSKPNYNKVLEDFPRVMQEVVSEEGNQTLRETLNFILNRRYGIRFDRQI